jgi:hypothetical protein
MNPHTKERKKEVAKLIKQASKKMGIAIKIIIKMPQQQQHPSTSSRSSSSPWRFLPFKWAIWESSSSNNRLLDRKTPHQTPPSPL